MAKKKDISVLIMVLIIVAVAVLGGFAVAPTISNIISQNESTKRAERLSNGTATVEDLANNEGLKVDEFIAKYELTSDDVNKNTGMAEFGEKLTLKNYCTFVGVTYSDESLEAYKTVYEASLEESEESDDEEKKEITADTTDMEIKYGFAQYLYSMEQESETGTETEDAVSTEAEDIAE